MAYYLLCRCSKVSAGENDPEFALSLELLLPRYEEVLFEESVDPAAISRFHSVSHIDLTPSPF